MASRTIRLVSDRGLSDGEILEALLLYLAEHQRAPTPTDWDRSGPSPAERTIRRRFGSPGAALTDAVRPAPAGVGEVSLLLPQVEPLVPSLDDDPGFGQGGLAPGQRHDEVPASV